MEETGEEITKVMASNTGCVCFCACWQGNSVVCVLILYVLCCVRRRSVRWSYYLFVVMLSSWYPLLFERDRHTSILVPMSCLYIRLLLLVVALGSSWLATYLHLSHWSTADTPMFIDVVNTMLARSWFD